MPKKTWAQFHADVKSLAAKFGPYRPDIIAPVMLGGLAPGAIIAKELGIKDVRPIDIEREGEQRRLAYDVQGSIAGKKVLIVEDDLPTGKGPALVKKIFEQRGAEVKIATVYATPESEPIADFFAEVLKELPDYPWKKFHRGDRLRK